MQIYLSAGKPLSIIETLDKKKQRYIYGYKAQNEGKYTVEVKHCDEHVDRSPYNVGFFVVLLNVLYSIFCLRFLSDIYFLFVIELVFCF